MAIEKITNLNEDVITTTKKIDDVTTAEDTALDATVVVDVNTANACKEAAQAAEHVEEVMTALEETAETVITPAPEIPEVKQENIYTKKLTLDESVQDFKLIDASHDEDDRYTEFDMFDFVYSLFASETDALIRPLKALKGRTKFMYQGSDDYADVEGNGGAQGIQQISTDIDGNILLYQDTKEAFDDVIDLCNEYKFRYEGPVAKRSPEMRWNFTFKVYVPAYADGYPMEVEDYFEKIGIPMEDVMPASFIKGREKDYKKMNDEVAVEATFKKYVHKAGNSNDPLEGFIKDMFAELESDGVKYNKSELKRRFLKEFEDDFEDED